jgi:peptidoglycan/xylan/chitin deacetylase (PgdA/CDA1 family)
MTSDTSQQNSTSDWFLAPPSRLKRTSVWAACQAASVLHNLRGTRCSNGFAILMYHRVADEIPGVETPTMNVTPQQLRCQLAGLLALGFECWPLARLVVARAENRVLPPNVFAITFDDGFENNYLHAWPILRELNTPATIFVATKYLNTDQPFPFDDWPPTGSSRVPKSAWHPLSTRQCEEMLEGGLVEIGAHTHSHEKFLGRSSDFRRDLRLCLDVLRDRFGIERPSFAFPYGFKSPELVDTVKQLGVACSLSTRARRVLPGESPYEWGRIWTEPNDTPAMLAARMCWYTTVANAGKPLVTVLNRLERATNRKIRNHRPGIASGEFSGASKVPSSP